MRTYIRAVVPLAHYRLEDLASGMALGRIARTPPRQRAAVCDVCLFEAALYAREQGAK